MEIKKAGTDKEISDAQEVRRIVFIEEQGISADLDIDGQDKLSDHFVAYSENKPIATTRIRYINKDLAKIERTAVITEFRGKGVGKQLIEKSINYLEKKGVKEIVLHAQEHAKGFYKKLGFEQRGEEFEEAGIRHVKMFKYIKNFDGWNIKKKSLDKKNRVLYCYEREIWWCSLGVNIGYEEDGKNKNFERPVLILKTFPQNLLLTIPLTTANRVGRYYYNWENEAFVSTFILSQIKLISGKRLIRKIKILPKEHFNKIKEEILKFLQ